MNSLANSLSKSNEVVGQSNHMMSTSPMATMYLKTHNNVWTPDQNVLNCTKCNAAFGMTVWRHHCRGCGDVCCGTCASKYIEIPEYIPVPMPKDTKNLSYYITSLKAKAQRVCNACHGIIQNKINTHERMLALFEEPTDIEDLIDHPCEVSDCYYHELCNIQYHLPNHVFTDMEKQILLVNMKYFAGHSKYLTQLFKVVDFNEPGMTERLTDILIAPKIKQCADLYCTGTCSDTVKYDDILNILYSRAGDLPEPILLYLFQLLNECDGDLILSGCTFLTSLIPQYQHLHTYLYELFNKPDQVLIYRSYWQLSTSLETASPSESSNINKFIARIEDTLLRRMHREYLFFARLIDSLDNPGIFLTDNFKIPIKVPYDPSITLYSADVESIVRMDSKTKPVVITFNSSKGKLRLMFKRESVANDHCVLNLLRVVNIVLKQVLNTDKDLPTYSSMPLTANSGIVEFVEDADTLSKLDSEKRPLSQFLMDCNDDDMAPNIKEIRGTYSHSLVAYTLMNYFLGLVTAI